VGWLAVGVLLAVPLSYAPLGRFTGGVRAALAVGFRLLAAVFLLAGAAAFAAYGGWWWTLATAFAILALFDLAMAAGLLWFSFHQDEDDD